MKRALSSTLMVAPRAAALLVQSSAPCSSLISRSFSNTSVLRGMEEFFPTPLPEGEKPQPAGRSWEAAELRLKSQEDLHKLWFVCLKERNMLLSERLYYRQVGQAAAEGDRLLKVKKTMARIKVVIGERARAKEAYERDQRLLGKLKASTEPKIEGTATEAALPKAPRLSGQTVTYKQYGRSYTVPVEMAPEKPTRQQRKVAAKTARYYSRVAKLRGQLEAAEGAVGYTPKPNASAIGSGGVKSAVGAGQ